MLAQVLLEPPLGVDVHGADLEHREGAAAQAGALLLEDGRPALASRTASVASTRIGPASTSPSADAAMSSARFARTVVRPEQVRRVLDGESAAEVAQLGALDRQMLERSQRDHAIEVLLQQVERGLRRQLVAGEDRDLHAALGVAARRDRGRPRAAHLRSDRRSSARPASRDRARPPRGSRGAARRAASGWRARPAAEVRSPPPARATIASARRATAAEHEPSAPRSGSEEERWRT